MDDSFDTPSADPAPADDAPTVSCRRCGREWDLEAELSAVGNQAFEQFALDHRRHTGHFPDGIETWRVTCRHCPEETERLAREAARRWAETHARHTRHDLEILHATGDEVTLVEAEEGGGGGDYDEGAGDGGGSGGAEYGADDRDADDR